MIKDLLPSSADLQSYVTLNRMQSIVQPTAMGTNENLLICGESPALFQYTLTHYSPYRSCELPDASPISI